MTTLTVRRGDTYTRSLAVAQADGTAYDFTGATVYMTVRESADQADAAAPIRLSWISGGASSGITIAAPTSGVAVIVLSAAQTESLDLDIDYVYDVEVQNGGEVDTPISGALIVQRPAGATSGISRKQLRRDILGDLGDLRILEATAAGSDVTFIDAVNLIGEVGAYTGREVLFTGGTVGNIGEVRYVTGSSSTSRAIGFGVALPAATAEGDEAELFNTRGTGYRLRDVNDAINKVIRSVRDRALVVTAADDGVYARGEGIAIPDSFRTVEDIQWQSESDEAIWHSIPKAKNRNGRGWYVDQSTRTIVVGGGGLPWRIDGRTVKVWGLAQPAELADDSDVTAIDPEWLVMAAQAQLARARYMRMQTPETERLMYMLSQQADTLRRKVITRRGPFSEGLAAD